MLISGEKLFVIAGPCVIEPDDYIFRTASALKKIAVELDILLIFKASFQKDNRRSIKSYRGIGLEDGLRVLEKISKEYELPICTDIHHPEQAKPVAEVADVLQIPAMLCRQTDLLVAASMTGRTINIKKGQFLDPRDMETIAEKAERRNVLLTERGTTFGYQDLVVDVRSIPIMKSFGYPVVIDAGHGAVDSRMTETIARAGIAAGANGLFVEVHHDPAEALSDVRTQFPLKNFKHMLKSLISLREWVVSNP